MGGMGGAIGGFLSNTGTQFGMQGLSTGIQTGSSIAHAEYNAAAMRQQADSLRQQSAIQAYMIQNSYRKQYQQLLDQQKAQQSMNRAIALKRGITGASAAEVLGSYAAKGQKNLDQLYYNAAMQSASSAIQYGGKINSLEEKARQYDNQAMQSLIGGVINLGTGLMNTYTKNSGAKVNPNDQFDQQQADAMRPDWNQIAEEHVSIMQSGGQSVFMPGPNLGFRG